MTKRSAPRLGVKIAIASSALIVTIGVLELGLRTISPVGFRAIPEPLPNDVWRELVNRPSSVPGLLYELRPDAENEAHGVRVRTNAHGMRDRERTLEKPDSVFRIAVLGDSYTFGYGVENGETYPAVLEELLNEGGGDRRFEVLNFGVSGYSTRDEAVVLERKALAFDPDLVVIGYVYNDPDIWPDGPLGSHFRRPEWWQHSHLLRLVAQARQAFNVRRYGKGNFTRYLHEYPPAWNSVLEAFGRIRATADSTGIPVVVAISGSGRRVDEEVYDKVSRTSGEHGFRVVDLMDSRADTTMEALRLSWDRHPSPLKHRLAAEAIRDTLRSLGLVRPVVTRP